MQHFLQQPDTAAHAYYTRLRQYLFQLLWLFRQASQPVAAEYGDCAQYTEALSRQVETLNNGFRDDVMAQLREQQIDGWQTSSLMNDINYAYRIGLSLLEVLPSACEYRAMLKGQEPVLKPDED